VVHVIKPDLKGLTVEVSEIAGKEEDLLSEFQACREGRCSCPTDEYAKLDALEIEDQAGKISLRLRAKSGQEFDAAEIEKCLDHVQKNLDPNR
jgi:hypothetical protein